MSGANDPYDPKQVAALSPEALDDAVTAAQKAFAEARDLEALAAVRPAHLGDRAPILLARRELGALPPAARSDAGKRVNARPGSGDRRVRRATGGARGRAGRPRAGRGAGRRHAAVGPRPARRPPPADHADRPDRRHLRGHGLRGRRRTRARGGVAEFRRPQHRPRPPGPHDDGHLLRRARGLRPGPAHAHQPGAGPHHAVPHAADLRRSRPAASTGPTSSTRRTRRSSTRSRGWRSTAG